MNRKCRECACASMESIRLSSGINLPYGGGLVTCSERGVGYYPDQRHSCGDFKEKNNDSEKRSGEKSRPDERQPDRVEFSGTKGDEEEKRPRPA